MSEIEPGQEVRIAPLDVLVTTHVIARAVVQNTLAPELVSRTQDVLMFAQSAVASVMHVLDHGDTAETEVDS